MVGMHPSGYRLLNSASSLVAVQRKTVENHYIVLVKFSKFDVAISIPSAVMLVMFVVTCIYVIYARDYRNAT